MQYTVTMKDVPYNAPTFTLVDDSGGEKSLSDYAGKWLVLYFYPKDNTPGCTVQACSLRDSYSGLQAAGAEVVGVSMDNVESHEAFKQNNDLPFTLLSDPDGAVIRAYGAWGKKMFGREGILRKTFIIDPDGVVQKVYGRATPMNHGTQVLSDLQALKQN